MLNARLTTRHKLNLILLAVQQESKNQKMLNKFVKYKDKCNVATKRIDETIEQLTFDEAEV